MRIGLAVIATLAFTLPGLAEDLTPQTYQNLLTPLLQGGNDVLGTPLAYPEGTPNVTSAIVTIPLPRRLSLQATS